MEKKIVLLTDYTGFLWSCHIGTKEDYYISSVDVKKIKKYLEEQNCIVEVYTFSELPEARDWNNYYVFYASSDKRGGFYKEYIEDVILGLENAGATLIPEFKYFRAHENKNFAEILRNAFKNEKLRIPSSKIYGCLQELDTKAIQSMVYPCVLKTANGSGSQGVCLIRNEEELLKSAKKFSAHSYYDSNYTPFRRFFEFGIGYQIKKLYHRLRKVRGHYKLEKDYTNKFLIQTYIPDLQGDYKVLNFGEKYYLLYRSNRENDFRASGSGKFVFPELTSKSEQVLNFARECVEEVSVPMLSMDIAVSGENCFLIEYQCICFGTYTLEFSEFYFKYNEEKHQWETITEKPDLEREIAKSLVNFMDSGMEY